MFLENGFNDYLSKPIERSRLAEILARWMPDPAVFQPGSPANAGVEASGGPQTLADTPPAAAPEIPFIEGVDTAQGMALTGDSPELYRDILALYCRDAAGRLAVLSEIPQPEKLLDFATHVHAVKSASANIGAEKMRALAAELETAAKSGDILFIERRLGGFAAELSALTARIQNALHPSGLPARESLASLSASDWEALKRLRAALETEETRPIEAVLREIKTGNPSPALRQILDDVAGNILTSEFAEAAAVIDGLPDAGAWLD
jgi:HPt (histidine-containing phosphotransfer) domain-containing protein